MYISSITKDELMMDSRQMYNATSHLTSIVTWKDWEYFGTDTEINYDSIGKLIDRYLGDSEILFINGRRDSGQYRRDEIIRRIKPFLGDHHFQLWTVTMNKVIQFGNIGVYRIGSIIEES